MQASLNVVIIGSGIGVSPVWHQVITCNNAADYQLEPQEQPSMKS